MGAAVVERAQHTALASEQQRYPQKLKGLGMPIGDGRGTGERVPEAVGVTLTLALSDIMRCVKPGWQKRWGGSISHPLIELRPAQALVGSAPDLLAIPGSLVTHAGDPCHGGPVRHSPCAQCARVKGP